VTFRFGINNDVGKPTPDKDNYDYDVEVDVCFVPVIIRNVL